MKMFCSRKLPGRRVRLCCTTSVASEVVFTDEKSSFSLADLVLAPYSELSLSFGSRSPVKDDTNYHKFKRFAKLQVSVFGFFVNS